MKINTAITTAASHFLQSYTDTEAVSQVLKQYALEELELRNEKAKEFAEKVGGGAESQYLATKDGYNRLYIWYYINYVVKDQNK